MGGIIDSMGNFWNNASGFLTTIGGIGGGLSMLITIYGWMTKKWKSSELIKGVRKSSVVPLADSSTMATSQTEVSVRHRRRFFAYPILAAISIPSVLIYLAIFILSLINYDLYTQQMYIQIIYYITWFIGIGTWIYAIVRTIQLRRWGWLIGMVLSGGVLSGGDGALILSIWGPTTRRGQREPLLTERTTSTVSAQTPSAPALVGATLVPLEQPSPDQFMPPYQQPPAYQVPRTPALSYQPSPSQPGMPSRMNGLSVAALVLGIIGIIVSWVEFVDLICPILAIIFGHVGLSQVNHSMKTQRGGGLAIAGFILGYIGLLLSAVILIYYFVTPS